MTKKVNEQPESNKKAQEDESTLKDQNTSKEEQASSSAPQEKPTQDSNKSTTKPATPRNPQENNKEKKPSSKLAIIAILIALGIGAAGFYKLQEQDKIYQAEIAALKTQIEMKQNEMVSSLEDTQAQTIQKATELTHRAEVAIEQQQNSIESLQLAISDVQGRRPNDWLLAEADHLVKLAGRKLFLEKDAVTATRLMETADQRIATLNDPSLVPLRQQMAKDITTLKGIPLVDREGLVLRLTALQQQVSGLPLANAILPEAQPQEEITVSNDINDWQDNLKNSLKSFSENFITFRSRDGNVIPLLSPQQHFYLSENIKGKLETAIKSVYLEQGEIYQTSLANAVEWSETFFDQDEHQVKQFNSALKELQQQDIDVTYPQALVSQQPLEDVISDRLRRNVTSIVEESE
ncbi:heme biosynthesis operon protein HemX [Vibrio astriarenae]|uniref:Heme biosynthesis operon protein HemX n=1 Tax=Vibrio astriarenae TaxID=1481923 RepID=A0A7Z2T0S9_9VIBR|nr:uroporphyrinogen-III C-methyltransferase [Vibrio astriarenae]QIA62157.1 heme biosynthesis operon protein HemX [Vibrio astriarenae]